MHSQTARWAILHVDKTNWKGAGVVDRGGLENRCTLAGTQGSNPCLSAKKAAEFQRLSCIKDTVRTLEGFVIAKRFRSAAEKESLPFRKKAANQEFTALFA